VRSSRDRAWRFYRKRPFLKKLKGSIFISRASGGNNVREDRRDLNDAKILFIRLSSLGDLILTLPTLKAIKDRYPQAHIAWLVQDSLQDVLAGNPYLDEILPVDLLSVTDKYANHKTWLQGGGRFFRSLGKAYRMFRNRKFDVVLEFQALFKSGIFASLNRGAERYGFKNAREMSRLFLNHPIFVRDKSRHAVENYLQFARHFGCSTEDVGFPIHIPPEDEQYIEQILLQEGIKPGDFTVFVSATARWQSKFWEQEAFACLCD
jgi:heptosyltransferase-1